MVQLSHPYQDFPDSSVGKESTCNAGDPGSIPELGRSTGKWTGSPLQYSWASLVAKLVKNPPAMHDLGLIPDLGRSLGKGKGYPLQYSGLENSMICIVHGVTESDTTEWFSLHSLANPIKTDPCQWQISRWFFFNREWLCEKDKFFFSYKL